MQLLKAVYPDTQQNTGFAIDSVFTQLNTYFIKPGTKNIACKAIKYDGIVSVPESVEVLGMPDCKEIYISNRNCEYYYPLFGPFPSPKIHWISADCLNNKHVYNEYGFCVSCGKDIIEIKQNENHIEFKRPDILFLRGVYFFNSEKSGIYTFEFHNGFGCIVNEDDSMVGISKEYSQAVSVTLEEGMHYKVFFFCNRYLLPISSSDYIGNHYCSYLIEQSEIAKCELSGVDKCICMFCGDRKERTVSALGHKFAAGEPYCQNGCGAVNPDYVPPHTHNYASAITTAPTCTQAGVKTFTCSCGDAYTEPVAALGHNYGEWTQTKAPTCTEAGEETRICTRDVSHTETREVAALGHSFAASKQYCQNGCGAVNPDYVPPHVHTYNAVVTAPKATALGYTLHTCSGCGKSYRDAYTAPTGKQAIKCKTRTATAQTVYWNNVKTATGYQVQISTKDGKKWSTYATLKAGVTSYTFKNLAAGNNYKFRVRFYINAADGKNYFSPWSATLNSPTLPAGTTITKLTPAKRAFVAQWKKQAVSGYQVQYSLKANFEGAKTITIKNANLLKTTVSKLNAGKYYFVRIRTYKTIAKANYCSAWSKTYKVKTK